MIRSMIKEWVRVKKAPKFYMAIGMCVPEVGKQYKLRRFVQTDYGNIKFECFITNNVKSVKKLANNIYVVDVKTARYITCIVGEKPEKTFFAMLCEKPEIGENMRCSKVVIDETEDEYAYKVSYTNNWVTTFVREIVPISENLWQVKTNNSVYICFLINR